MILTAILLIFVASTLAKIYLKWTTGWCKSNSCLINKTAIITGANTGIGYEIALDFAKRGARVILACRDKNRAEKARLRIINETGNENILVKIIDLGSFDSVKNFAKEINESEDRLDILVNNAGILAQGDKTTPDGHPLIMQVNYYSAFLLTNFLLDLLKKNKSRVVNVSSNSAGMALLFNLSKLDQHVSDGVDYFNSKLCNVLFTQELAKKLDGTQVTTYSVHPGITKTQIFDTTAGFRGFLYKFLAKNTHLFKTCEEGAQPVIYCSVTKNLERFSGHHFVDCRKIRPYLTARDPVLAQKLWQQTEAILNKSFPANTKI